VEWLKVRALSSNPRTITTKSLYIHSLTCTFHLRVPGGTDELYYFYLAETEPLKIN
jgi:hypothetical protein